MTRSRKATRRSVAAAALLLTTITAALAGAAIVTHHHQPAATARQPVAAAPANVRGQAFAAYRSLPLTFTPNAGQADPRVRYYAQTPGLSVFFARSEAMLALRRPGKTGKTAAVALRFLGANPTVAIRGEQQAPGRVNYLIGNDRSRWHTNLRTYERVVYRTLWPGIDLAFHGRNGSLTYEFLVRPGARVADIRLAYRGAKPLILDRTGKLRVRTPAGLLVDDRPVSYQLDAAGNRVPVASRFALTGHGYGFAIGRGYDRHKPLVIDPNLVLVYSTYLGGSNDDWGNGIAVDSAKSAYVTGYTASTNFSGATNSLNGGEDAFVTKLLPGGAGVAYSTFVGGSASDQGVGIATDAAATPHAYIIGATASSDLPLATNGYNGPFDAFVTKLDGTGGVLWSKYLGGSGDDQGRGIAVDSVGNAYVTGTTGSTTFTGATNSSAGSADAFVTELDPNGSVVYSRFLGGGGYDDGEAIAVDSGGLAYVTGETNSTNLPTTVGAYQPNLGGGWDAFVAKLTATGALTGAGAPYLTYLGGSGNENEERSSGIAVDSVGNAYLTGSTDSAASTFVPPFAPIAPYHPVDKDAFVAKLPASGAPLTWFTYLGGTYADRGTGIAVGVTGRAFVAGATNSTDFPTTAGALPTTPSSENGFVARVEPTGVVRWASYLGTNDVPHAIAVDAGWCPYVTGSTAGSFPTTGGSYRPTYQGGSEDAFVAKLDYRWFIASCTGFSVFNVSKPVLKRNETPKSLGGLTCDPGTWSEPGDDDYAWLRDGVVFQNPSTRPSKYDLLATDVGHEFTCRVTRANKKGPSEPALSNAITITAPVVPQIVTDLIALSATVTAMHLNAGPTSQLTNSIDATRKSVERGDSPCAGLAGLKTLITDLVNHRKLTAAQSATLNAAVDAITAEVACGSALATTLSSPSSVGDTTVTVASTTGLHPGDAITIDTGPNKESATIVVASDPHILVLSSPLAKAHAAGAAVTHP